MGLPRRGTIGLGKWGEDRACEFLQRRGFVIVERNYRVRYGEIDIIARGPGREIYFIEVKTRTSPLLANDLAVTPAKRRILSRTIRHYCYQRAVSEDDGLLSASLIVRVTKSVRKISFRLAVYC